MDFIEVTREEFFRQLGNDPRDIMASVENPDFTLWRTTRDRTIWGKTLPGWKQPNAPVHYFIYK